METIVNHEPTFFVGRNNLLQELHEMLQDRRRVVISAPAGVGKTALALEYARRFSHKYEWIFHMDMTSTASWLADCLELVERFALPISPEEQSLTNINQALQDWLVQHQNTLLIVDNIGRVELPIVPEQTTGQMLFLTRKPVSDPSIAQIKLTTLTTEEGALFFLHQDGQLPADISPEQADAESRSAAATLADVMGGLPLALSLASASMRVAGSNPQAFLALYRIYMERLVRLKSSRNSVADAIAITCSLPAISLQRTHPFVVELLWFCAILAPGDLPRELFLQCSGELTPILQEIAQKPALLDEALTLLSSLHLLTFDEATGTARMQMTVLETLRQAQKEAQRNRLITHALRAFSLQLPEQEQATPAARMRLAAQIFHLATLSSEWIIPYESVADAFGWAASLFGEQGLIQDAELLLRKALMIWERVLGTGHEAVGVATRNLGTLNVLLENYSVAETLLQSAMLARSRVLGSAHPEVILCLLDLAMVYAAQNKDNEARACYLEALKIGEPTLGQNHPLLMTATHRLALLSVKEGNLVEAEGYYQRVLPFYEATAGLEDSRTQECLEQMANVLLGQEKVEQAEELLQRLLAVRESTLGLEDSRTQETLEQMVNVLLEREKVEQAEELLQRLLTARESTLGIEDPDTRTLMYRIAQLLMVLGELNRAEDTYRRLSLFCEHALGQEHTETRLYLGQLLFLTETRQTLEQLASSRKS